MLTKQRLSFEGLCFYIAPFINDFRTMAPVMLRFWSIRHHLHVKTAGRRRCCGVWERLAYFNMRRRSHLLAPCLRLFFLCRTVIPTYNPDGSIADISVQPVIGKIVQNWINVNQTEALIRGSLFLYCSIHQRFQNYGSSNASLLKHSASSAR